jgi:hypothetical protein
MATGRNSDNLHPSAFINEKCKMENVKFKGKYPLFWICIFTFAFCIEVQPIFQKAEPRPSPFLKEIPPFADI